MTTNVHIGWVKHFSPIKGYGFVTEIASGNDFFVHYTSLLRNTRGWRGLYKGEYVQFNTTETASGIAAVNVRGISGGPLMCEAPELSSATFPSS
jgi:CspA family cold shock protein